jgi:hypothetical protein
LWTRRHVALTQLYEAARPMLIRFSSVNRLMLLSTAWAREGFFYKVWAEGSNQDWTKIEARIETCSHISKADIEAERRALPRNVWLREYENHFDLTESRTFDPDMIDSMFGATAATHATHHTRRHVCARRTDLPEGLCRMNYDERDPATWSRMSASPWIVGADIGQHVDHPAIVVGAAWPGMGHMIGIVHVEQLPLDTPMDFVADAIAKQVRAFPGSKAIVDLTNNTAFGSLLAARLGRTPGQHMIAANPTSAFLKARSFGGARVTNRLPDQSLPPGNSMVCDPAGGSSSASTILWINSRYSRRDNRARMGSTISTARSFAGRFISSTSPATY